MIESALSFWESRLNTEENARVVRRFTDEVITQGDIDSAAQFVWEDVVEQVPFPGQGPGLEGLKDVLRAMRSAFPDLHFAIQEQIAEGDKVASRFEWTGTHQHEFLGMPAPVVFGILCKWQFPTNIHQPAAGQLALRT